MLSSILNKDLFQQIMCLGYSSYLSQGIGCVILREPSTFGYTEVSQELLHYLAYTSDDRAFPYEAETMMKDYDPKKEVVLAVVDRTAKTLVLRLTAAQAGMTPVEAYRVLSNATGGTP